MIDENLCATIEAILFANAQPIELSRLSQILNMDKAPLRQSMLEFMESYNSCERGIKAIELDGYYQLCTKEKFAEYIKIVLEIKKNTSLTPSAMEVLAIISYNEPVTRAFVEQVRGVDSNYIINSLLNKELIEEAGRLDILGKPLSYKTSKNFLRCFGMKDLSELPPLPEKAESSNISPK